MDDAQPHSRQPRARGELHVAAGVPCGEQFGARLPDVPQLLREHALGLAGLTLVLGQAPSADEEKALRATVESYTAAFNRGDLDGLAAYFTADADFVDDGGKEYQGKSKLVDLLKRSLAELKRPATQVVSIDPYEAYRQAIRTSCRGRGSSSITSTWCAG